jgi:hypothetical protein
VPPGSRPAIERIVDAFRARSLLTCDEHDAMRDAIGAKLAACLAGGVMSTMRRFTVVTIAAVAFSLGSVTVRAVGADTRLAYRPPPPPLRTIKCESRGGKSTYCRTGVRGPVRMERQLSGTPCIPYDTWGADPDGGGIWVFNGCRALFVVGGGWGPPPAGGRGGQTVTCKSEGFQYNHCPLGRRRHVRLTKNLSDTRCIRGDNWDVDRRGIWVDRGCAGRFVVE